MLFWHELLAQWETAWREAPLPELPKVSLTPPEQKGILTLNIFPLFKAYKGNPQKAAEAVLYPLRHISHAEVIKGFVNISFTADFWADFLRKAQTASQGYTHLSLAVGEQLMVEYPSPNTNKPLHLGHLRNLCLGESVCRLWERLGAEVIRANLVNDRGIHISKSMIGWKRFFAPATPHSAGVKGDHFVGQCYVAFEKAYKAEVDELTARGLPEEEALVQAPLFQEAQALLRAWEAGDPNTLALWREMNGWVYEGFDQTFRRMSIRFDKIYYESETYLLGKAVVEEGLSRGIFHRAEDGAVWADLTDVGLGRKVLLRRDGTSVYITQDLGTADLKFRDYPNLKRSVYVIGNEQDHHMRLLAALLRRLGREFADKIYHLSYGMVELPTGRMKTREGTVVDADDLLDEMHARAYELTDADLSESDRHEIAEAVGQGALRFYLLRTDPKKNILFDPAESIDLKGFTGPFLQYGYVRAKRLLEKALEQGLDPTEVRVPETIIPVEEALLQQLYALPHYLESAAKGFDPALLAHYGYELTRRFNEFYQTSPVIGATEPARSFRLGLVKVYQIAIATVLQTLAIPLPERM
ncbi:MAG: arginine--tRNA ligase [Bacteroidia bacterium]|nr:arginine--tRNA ligase [Bacteroidia bacterium]MCX7651727.1 arginine--tRNA ligase [Bacteroidia bacterium]MDW8417672.1 arginine--tRNA ligase [Bacteroidia bacterium]